MALDDLTKTKLGDWFNSTATPGEAPATGGGMINAGFDDGSGTYGVQTATTGSPNTGTTMLNLGDVDKRAINQPTETVAGQMNSLLGQDSTYLQAARGRAAQQSNARGLLNSSMAAGAGEKAAIESALPIATADAATYGKAADYNVSTSNAVRTANAGAANDAAGQQRTIDANAGTQQRAIDAANATQRTGLDAELEVQRRAIDAARAQQQNTISAETAAAERQQASQLTIANLQAATSKYTADLNSGTSSADSMSRNRTTLVNNIMQSTELSPDRKADLFRAMGEYGFANAIYVVEGVTADLVQRPTTPGTISDPNFVRA